MFLKKYKPIEKRIVLDLSDFEIFVFNKALSDSISRIKKKILNEKDPVELEKLLIEKYSLIKIELECGNVSRIEEYNKRNLSAEINCLLCPVSNVDSKKIGLKSNDDKKNPSVVRKIDVLEL